MQHQQLTTTVALLLNWLSLDLNSATCPLGSSWLVTHSAKQNFGLALG